MTLFERTKEVANLRKMSLTEVAIKAGIGEKSIYQWKTSSPKSETLEKVADILNTTTDYLLGRTDNPAVDGVPDLREADRHVLSYGGKPISDEDWAIIKRILETGYAE